MTTLSECGFVAGLIALLEHKFNDGTWITLSEQMCHGKVGLILILLFYNHSLSSNNHLGILAWRPPSSSIKINST
jgi:hypothetical protein